MTAARLRRFNDVTYSYLNHCLGWFRALDLRRRTGLQPPALLALTIGI